MGASFGLPLLGDLSVVGEFDYQRKVTEANCVGTIKSTSSATFRASACGPGIEFALGGSESGTTTKCKVCLPGYAPVWQCRGGCSDATGNMFGAGKGFYEAKWKAGVSWAKISGTVRVASGPRVDLTTDEVKRLSNQFISSECWCENCERYRVGGGIESYIAGSGTGKMLGMAARAAVKASVYAPLDIGYQDGECGFSLCAGTSSSIKGTLTVQVGGSNKFGYSGYVTVLKGECSMSTSGNTCTGVKVNWPSCKMTWYW